MLKTSKATAWIVAATSAVGACVVVALISSIPTNSTAAKKVLRSMAQDAAVAAGSAREAAAAECARRVEAWRKYLRSARSPERLREFVEELTGLKQKFHLAMDTFRGPRLRQRVLEVFRRHIFDDRQLEGDLDATVAAYDEFLFEQDRQFYEPTGISREEWTQMVHGGWRLSVNWSRHLAPVVERAANEVCKDAVRFAGAQLVTDFAGDQIKKSARDAGLDKSDPGSFGDLATGFLADVGAGFAVDELTDVRDAIVSELADEMARAEHELLDGEGGLCWVLRRTEAEHEQARSELILATGNHKE